MTRAEDAAREAATLRLRLAVKPGDTLWLVERHRTAGGRQSVDVVHAPGNEVANVSVDVALLLAAGYDRRRGGLIVPRFARGHLVYRIGQRLWPGGFECIGVGCPALEHETVDQDFAPHHHRAGGYALRTRWL